MTTKTIRQDTSTQGQNAYYFELLNASHGAQLHTLQIKIKTDTVKSQQSATIDRWDGAKWQPIASLLPGSHMTSSDLAYAPQGRLMASHFAKDRTRLIDIAQDILTGNQA